ncbi:MAG: hypothetical protein JWP97_1971 [Labilithrix sp.]|nr:hypothetical protein [Labilithrix sp.]
MKKSLPFVIVMAVCTVALVASAILLVDYVRPAPVFCDAEGGCGIVRRTIFAYPMGIPTPLLGIAGFLAIGLAELVPGRRARVAQLVLSAFGALVAAGLLAVQGLLHTICPFCAVADTAALALLVLSIARLRRGWDPPAGRGAIGGAVLALVVGTGLPIAVGMNKKAIEPPLPDVIAAEIAQTPRGRVTVVDFVDFECPFCRMTHASLGPLLDARKDRVRLVRKHVPLRMHAHAMDAAKAACCGEKLGKGNEVAEALFTAPPEQLTPEGCEAIAAAEGLDLAAFRECVKDPATDARIKADVDTFHAAKGHGLPTLYIDRTKLEGSQDEDTLRATLDGALHAL